MSHTPGPWRVWMRSDDTLQVVATPLPVVCEMWHADGCDSANARLIAAAPELLEALESLRLMSQAMDMHDMVSIAELAIKKAKGGAE